MKEAELGLIPKVHECKSYAISIYYLFSAGTSNIVMNIVNFDYSRVFRKKFSMDMKKLNTILRLLFIDIVYIDWLKNVFLLKNRI